MRSAASLLAISLIFSLGALVPAGAKPVKPAPAPAWTLKDVDGKPVPWSQFKGKVVVIDFWATWCPPCRTEIPGYVALQKKYTDDGLVFIGISVDGDDSIPAVKAFVTAYEAKYGLVPAQRSFFAYESTNLVVDAIRRAGITKVGVVTNPENE